MDLNFECTQCGRCCHDLRLPLSLSEAIAWLDRGHEVQLLCEAIPWPSDPSPDDHHADNKRRRSFLASSGSMPIRVIVTLAASFRGACPNLTTDNRCAIYASRPSVCRIYPAEINPFIVLQPRAKECPSEAWASDRPAFVRAGILVNAMTRSLIHQCRVQGEEEVDAKKRLCRLVGVNAAAMANEGYLVHSPERNTLMRALTEVVKDQAASRPSLDEWTFVSDVRPTVQALVGIGASAIATDDVEALPFELLCATQP